MKIATQPRMKMAVFTSRDSIKIVCFMMHHKFRNYFQKSIILGDVVPR